MIKKNIVIYTKKSCPFCENAKNLLNLKNISYKEISLENCPELLEKIMSQSGRKSVPQIFINGKFIGGYQEIKTMNAHGELEKFKE